MRERKYRRLHLGRIRGSVVISAPHTSACISHDSPVLEPAMRRMFSTALDGGVELKHSRALSVTETLHSTHLASY